MEYHEHNSYIQIWSITFLAKLAAQIEIRKSTICIISLHAKWSRLFHLNRGRSPKQIADFSLETIIGQRPLRVTCSTRNGVGQKANIALHSYLLSSTFPFSSLPTWTLGLQHHNRPGLLVMTLPDILETPA